MSRHSAFSRMDLLVIFLCLFVLGCVGLHFLLQGRIDNRSVSCMQNQQQWAHATLTYAETFQEYPGYSNKIGTGTRATWQVRLLPFVDRNDLYDVWTGKKPPANGQSATPTPYLANLICPNNPPDTPVCQSSFVANCGAAGYPEYAGNGIFVNRYDGPLIIRPDTVKDGIQFTLLFSENLQAGNWNANVPNTAPLSSEDCKRLTGMVFFDDDSIGTGTRRINRGKSDPGPAATQEYSRPSSMHTGGVNVVFCDAHCQFLSDSISYDVYRQLMTVDTAAATPGPTAASTPSAPYPAALPALKDADYQ